MVLHSCFFLPSSTTLCTLIWTCLVCYGKKYEQWRVPTLHTTYNGQVHSGLWDAPKNHSKGKKLFEHSSKPHRPFQPIMTHSARNCGLCGIQAKLNCLTAGVPNFCGATHHFVLTMSPYFNQKNLSNFSKLSQLWLFPSCWLADENTEHADRVSKRVMRTCEIRAKWLSCCCARYWERWHI